jgi:hypothetical protein
MRFNKKFLVLSILLFFCSIAIVSAEDMNATDVGDALDNSSLELAENDIAKIGDVAGNASDNPVVEKSTPKISLASKSVKSKDTLEFTFKNSSGKPLKSKKLTVNINNHKYSIKTNSKGIAKLKINLDAKKYKLTVSYKGDKKYNSITKDFKIKVSKLKTQILPLTNFVKKGGYLKFYLYDQRWDAVKGKKITFKLSGKKYAKTTDKSGGVKLKINLPKSKYSINAKFKGDKQYSKSSKSIKFHIVDSMDLKLENSKLLTKGYLRVYLKDSGSVHKKNIKVNIGKKKLSKKTNSEGILIFKPKVDEKTYKVTVKMGKYRVWKKIRCIEGKTKDPLKENVTYKNGHPDIDVMPGNYVTGDGSAKYTLTKSQYREVLKRDSQCLFLNNKLTKYTFFKTKSHPKLNHIIKREKWNVIERAINEKLVIKNKYGYWPGKISVSLKGKSYKYPYVRDVQSNGLNCGPTSCSMCSQVLKNYMCEKYLAKLAKTDRYGTKCSNMIKALAKKNMKATYFYKSSFSEVLNELKNGGTALVFHANNHYVSILDISKNGKKVLVSNSYGSYDNIPTKWIKVSYMKKKFSPQWDESLMVKLNYKLSASTKNSITCYYNSMGKNWVAQNTHHSIGRI